MGWRVVLRYVVIHGVACYVEVCRDAWGGVLC